MAFVTIGSSTNIGHRKKENEDYVAFYSPKDGSIPKKGILIALADGMGGRRGGAIAAKLAVDTIMKEYYRDDSSDVIKSLKNAVIRANEEVISKGDEDRSVQGMGTTIVVVALFRDKFYYTHVGDSRGYFIYDNKITQFTEDHSIVAGLVKAGYITEEEAPSYPGGNVITKAIGIDPELKVDDPKVEKNLRTGQYIILCCDGLYKDVTNEQILETFRQFQEPDEICDDLVKKALDKGGDDNITVLVARINETGGVFSGVSEKLKGLFN